MTKYTILLAAIHCLLFSCKKTSSNSAQSTTSSDTYNTITKYQSAPGCCTIAYDVIYDSQKIKELRESSGRTTTFSYNSAGQLTEIRQGITLVKSISYDVDGNVMQISDGTNKETFKYSNGKLWRREYYNSSGNRNGGFEVVWDGENIKSLGWLRSDGTVSCLYTYNYDLSKTNPLYTQKNLFAYFLYDFQSDDLGFAYYLSKNIATNCTFCSTNAASRVFTTNFDSKNRVEKINQSGGARNDAGYSFTYK